MGESGKRELRKELREKTEKRQKLRKTPEGEREGNGKNWKRKRGKSGETGGGNSFLWGVNINPKITLYLDFSSLGIIIYMSKEYLIFKE